MTEPRPYRRVASAFGRTIAINGIDQSLTISIHVTLFVLFVWEAAQDFTLTDWLYQGALQLWVIRPLLLFSYFSVMVPTNGFTLGLYLMRARLAKHDGTPIGFLTVLGWICPSFTKRIPIVGQCIGTINFFMVFFNKRRRALGDYVVQTAVVVNTPHIAFLQDVKEESWEVWNASKNIRLAGQCWSAVDWWERTIGLRSFKARQSLELLFIGVRRVAIYFRKKATDYLFLDEKGTVLGFEQGVGAWRTIRGPSGCCMVLAVNGGSIEESKTEIGDCLRLETNLGCPNRIPGGEGQILTQTPSAGV